MWLLYNLLLTLASPIWVPWMLWRAHRRKEQPNWKERCGEIRLPKTGKPRIWLHAVSVGEVVAALPVLREVRAAMPGHEVILSVTTSSGHQTARERATGLFDHLVYFPIDVPRFALAAMSRARPEVVAIFETELWMNFLWAAKAVGARTVVINGRISDRSFRRARPFRFFYRSLLRHLDEALMQTDKDADRIRALGAKSARVLGNTKFDEALEGLDADPSALRADLGLEPGLPVVVVGSTRGDEAGFVLEAVARLASPVQVIHAPRHLETVEAIAEQVRGRLGAVARRSRGERGRYLLLDTYGELSRVYAVADVVVVGGGFEPHGGQNLIQPLAHGKPVLHGPHMANFREAAAMAAEAGATRVCATPESLAAALAELLADGALRESMGSAGRALVAAQRGASARYASALAQGP